MLIFDQQVKVSASFQAISQGNNHEAVVCMQRCKDMLLRLPKEVKKAYLTFYIAIKREGMFLLFFTYHADCVPLPYVLQLWNRYVQPKKV